MYAIKRPYQRKWAYTLNYEAKVAALKVDGEATASNLAVPKVATISFQGTPALQATVHFPEALTGTVVVNATVEPTYDQPQIIIDEQGVALSDPQPRFICVGAVTQTHCTLRMHDFSGTPVAFGADYLHVNVFENGVARCYYVDVYVE